MKTYLPLWSNSNECMGIKFMKTLVKSTIGVANDYRHAFNYNFVK